jgi:hypothetical protein
MREDIQIHEIFFQNKIEFLVKLSPKFAIFGLHKERLVTHV